MPGPIIFILENTLYLDLITIDDDSEDMEM